VTALAIAVTTLIGVATVDTARAADCPGPSVLAFVDTTTAYYDQDRELIMPAIDDMVRSLAPGSRLIIRTVRDALSSSRLLLDICTPAPPAITWTMTECMAMADQQSNGCPDSRGGLSCCHS
jgi:hypothetical protein